MTGLDTAPDFTRTPHLVGLVAEAERLAAVLDAVGPDDPVVAATAARAAVATLRLDGSPIEVPPTGPAPEFSLAAVPTSRRGTWLDALGRGELTDADATRLTALEFHAAVAGLGSSDLAEPLFSDPVATLAALHGRLTAGLLAPEHAGRPRRTDQAVHDASTGRVVYFPTATGQVERELHLLGAWLAGPGVREHGLIVSGVLHLALLRIHPFEAANGRLARTAARLVLRGRGLDPAGQAAAELELADDPIGYHEEVARTLRRRDHTIWLERWAEAVTGGLRASARAVGLLDVRIPDRPARFLATWPDAAFTVADYRAEVAVGPEDARADLQALLDADAVRRVPASRGLRFTRTSPPNAVNHPSHPSAQDRSQS